MLKLCATGIGRRLPFFALILSIVLPATPASSQIPQGNNDALLAIDQQRTKVIERVVERWGAPLAQSSAHVSIDELRTRLEGLRADHLLAASLAGTLDALRGALAIASAIATKPALPATRALGDAAIDAIYTPVTPCRLVETRGVFAAVYQGNGTTSHTPVPFTTNQIRTYTVQGGNGVCLTQLPAGLKPTAVQLQVFGMPTTSNSGDIEILPQGAAFGGTATMVYTASIAFNTVSTNAKINLASNQISVQVRGGGAHLAIDVVGYFKSAADTTAMNIQVNGQRVMRYEYKANGPNIIGGNPANAVSAGSAGQTIAGGGFDSINCVEPTTGQNTRSCVNFTNADFATVSGGVANQASAEEAAVGGGGSNTASRFFSTVSGGFSNTASGDSATVGGGVRNTSSGFRATIPGGDGNTADGSYSVAMGTLANALHDRSFVWSGWSSGSAASFRTNSFQIHGENGLSIEYGARRVDGGGTSWVFIGNGFAGQAIATSTGAFLSSGGAWINNSDRDRKTDLRSIDSQEILQKVSALPITTWQYKDEEATIRHMGPMAQDFHQSFGLGYDGRTIPLIDASGVALAAIQGLHRVVSDQAAQIQTQREVISAQERRISHFEAQARRILELEARMALVERGTPNLNTPPQASTSESPSVAAIAPRSAE